jgi:hypothetical protein
LRHNEAVMGEQYLFIATDSETKLVPTFRVGKRNIENAGHADLSWPLSFSIAPGHRIYSERQAREEYWVRGRCRFIEVHFQPAVSSAKHLGRNGRLRERMYR